MYPWTALRLLGARWDGMARWSVLPGVVGIGHRQGFVEDGQCLLDLVRADFMLTPINDENRELGDTIAAWLVANADQLAVKYIIWNERIWSRDRADEGWRDYVHPSGNQASDTLAHRDHIHLSIY